MMPLGILRGRRPNPVKIAEIRHLKIERLADLHLVEGILPTFNPGPDHWLIFDLELRDHFGKVRHDICFHAALPYLRALARCKAAP